MADLLHYPHGFNFMRYNVVKLDITTVPKFYASMFGQFFIVALIAINKDFALARINRVFNNQKRRVLLIFAQ
ncbi:MAG: hypothetical protein FD128_796 [Hyphomonadaceae bacterium]|nr:MAG: hypothetical protein FD128_796 [Hyphomonadaceae bacterium]